MLVPALLLMLTLGALILFARRAGRTAHTRPPPPTPRLSRRPARRAPHTPPPPRPRPRPAPRPLRRPPPTPHAAHAARPGARALNAGKARVRPGHRCVEAARPRSHVDFVDTPVPGPHP